MRRWLRRSAWLAGGAAVFAGTALAVLWHVIPFPLARLEHWPRSAVVTDRAGRVLAETVGPDEQWRFPVALAEVSPLVIQATIAAEDARFREHWGVDPRAVLRAAGQNLYHLHVVSGASTLTMQVCRMLDERPRTLTAKAIESFRALQLERCRSKDQILEAYLNLAPYGRNLRGISAASQAYFGKRPADLSLAEAALLAGLPQSPTRLRPDRHTDVARARRDVVLARMAARGFITSAQQTAAAAEPVHLVAWQRPWHAPHAALLALSRRSGGGQTTLDPALQTEVEQLVAAQAPLSARDLNAAVVVIDIARAEVVALVGSRNFADPRDGQLDGAVLRRSPGSALKPFIYAAAFEAGRLAPDSTVYDVAIDRGGWEPENFDRTYAGPLSAADALRRSLNVPAILVAEGLGVPRCVGVLEAAGVRLPAGATARGGLAIATGGAEVTLLDLTNAYATLGRGGVRRPARLFADEPAPSARVLSSNTCATLAEILSSHRRQPQGFIADGVRSVPWFMWKTGTSSGRRDAWAVGHNGRYAVGVWVGRFDATGAADLVGRDAAEPLLSAAFALPQVRQDAAPPLPQLIIVTQPLPPPPERAARLCIVQPSNGAEFLATGATAIVHARANRAAPLRWFLNGQLLTGEQNAAGAVMRLALAPGHYELRCLTTAAEQSTVQFVVRPAARALSQKGM